MFLWDSADPAPLRFTISIYDFLPVSMDICISMGLYGTGHFGTYVVRDGRGSLFISCVIYTLIYSLRDGTPLHI